MLCFVCLFVFIPVPASWLRVAVSCFLDVVRDFSMSRLLQLACVTFCLILLFWMV